VILLAIVIGSTLICGCDQPAESLTGNPTGVSPVSTTSRLEERIRRVEQGLVPFGRDLQPLFGHTATLSERMDHYGVPGVSVAVIEDFGISWARGYGVLEAGGDEPVTPDTLFHACSVAKPVSAAAALTLVDQDLLSLDDDVNSTLQSWQIPESHHSVEEKVSLRRLLSHSAGIRDGFTERSSSDPEPDYFAPAGQAPTVTPQQLLDAAPGIDVDRATQVTAVPGTSYRYANADYVILELLIADVTHQPFAQFMQETILDPLYMTSSTYRQPLPEPLRRRATTEHSVNGDPFQGKRHHMPMVAAGGLWTTPTDLARFAIEVMRAYQGKPGTVLSQKMAREMFRAQIGTPDDPISESQGLGWDLSGEGRDLRGSLPGGSFGSTSLLWVYPERGQGAVIMTNSAAAQGAIRFEILLSLMNEYGWPLSGDDVDH
jgi:CubicO group peptidase (beta-lactamase class C family)